MNQRALLLVPILLGLAPSATAQVVEAWSVTLDRSATADRVHDGHVDAFGTTTLVGSRVPGPQDRVATIARVEAFSAVVFERDFVLPAMLTEFLELEPDGQGGFYARGSAVSALGASSALLVRYDAAGNVVWSVTDAALVAKDVAVDPSGDVWLVGNTGDDVGVRRYTPAGALVASVTWNGPANLVDQGNGITPDGQGGAYVAARADAAYYSKLALLKLDSAGNVLWSRTTGDNHSEAVAAAVGASGDVYVAGTWMQGAPGSPFAVLAYDAQGAFLWSSQIYDLNSYPAGRADHVAVDAHGDVVAVGNGWWSQTEGDVLVRKLTPAGVVLWTRASATPGIGWDAPESMVLDDAGDVFVAGVTGPNAHPFTTDALVMRVDRDGALRWKTSFGTAGLDDVATIVGVSAPGTVFVAANVADGADTDVRVVRYDEVVAPYCFGDGSGTACPCGNDSTAWDRAGCANSLGSAGRLDGTGRPSLADDTLVLAGSGMTNSSALYFQGGGAVAGGAGAVFGDGLLCASAPNVRLATRANVGGGSSYPGAGDPSLSSRGGVLVPGERTYQVWYRNVASFCTSAPFNLTNGVRVLWSP